MPEPKTATAESVRFHYIKSSLFRVVHVDGALGGVTPRGNIHLAVYSERAAIPRETLHSIESGGRLGPEQVVEGKEGIVREIDSDLVLSRQTAIELRDWLNARIEDLDKLLKQSGGDGTDG